MAVHETLTTLPAVRLEVHQAGRSVPYFFDQVDFLIGTVPGCDLRVPGADLPGVLCLLARHPAGVSFRRLAPTQVLLVNGQGVSRAELKDGDRLTLGALDVYVKVEAAIQAAAADVEIDDLKGADPELILAEVADREATVAQQLEKIERQTQQLKTDKAAFEAERAKAHSLTPREAIGADLLQRELQVAQREDELTRTKQLVESRTAEVERHKQEIAAVRQELSDIRRQLYDRYQERRDRLSGLQESIDRAARKVQDGKRELAEAQRLFADDRQQFTKQHAEITEQASLMAEERQTLAEQRRALDEGQAEVRGDLNNKLADLSAREERLAAQRQTLEARERQYQADVVRLDRRQGEIEIREGQLTGLLSDIEANRVQLQSESAELESQAQDLDALRTQLTEESARLEKQKAEQETLETQLRQRAASLEGQQAALAALRGRLERQREEMRQHEQQVEEQRQSQAAAIQAIAEKQRLQDRLQTELAGQADLLAHEKQQITEQQTVLSGALAKLKEAQDRIVQDEELVRERQREWNERFARQTETEGVLQGRMEQFAEAQARLDSERQTLRERTLALTQAEQAREALQEQLRRRGDDLVQKQKQLAEQTRQVQEQYDRLAMVHAEHDAGLLATRESFDARKVALDEQAAEITRRREELVQLEELQRRQIDDLNEKSRRLADQERALAEQQAKNQELWQSKMDETQRQRADIEGLRRQAQELLLEMPDLELRAGATLDRLSHVRDQAHDHLRELHSYVRQAGDELEAVHARVRHEQATLTNKEQDLRRLQDEHRLALAAFRQQMIDWQGQVSELRGLLKREEKGLENRQAKVERHAQKVEVAAQDLTREAAVLDAQQRTVAEQRGELDRQYVDLRDWYRRKSRELAGIPAEAELEPMSAASSGETSSDDETPLIPTERNILSLTGPVDPADQTLGDLLKSQHLIDGETLHALLVEARRQRRSLRHLLLAGGVVTTYQLALLETGQFEGLMLGQFRVIDRLRQTQHEAIYRVFDPRRGREAVLRHLSEASAQDAVLPDEYRQRFQHLVLPDAHVAGTLEVVDVEGRPAVLQEWLTGLPASDWPPLAAAPGVCYRLLTQATLGLSALHKQSLTHGRLSEANLLLTPQGLLKVCGAAEPDWLTSNAETVSTPADDLRALGRIVSGWCTPTGVRKGPKAKPLPDRMVAILTRMQAEEGQCYETARALLDDLDQASADVPANPEAWDRLLRYVRDHAQAEATLRQSA